MVGCGIIGALLALAGIGALLLTVPSVITGVLGLLIILSGILLALGELGRARVDDGSGSTSH